jgi:threonine/homoserine/homoserine lactone efflux protein
MLGANYGWPRALPFISGVALAFIAIYALCAAGVGMLVITTPWAAGALKWGGLAYMLWLSWRIARTAALQDAGQAKPLHTGHGLANCFANPKVWMLAISVVAQYAAQSTSWHALAALIFGAFGFASNVAWALLGGGLKPWLSKGLRLLWFNRAMGCALAVTALWIAFRTQI